MLLAMLLALADTGKQLPLACCRGAALPSQWCAMNGNFADPSVPVALNRGLKWNSHKCWRTLACCKC